MSSSSTTPCRRGSGRRRADRRGRTRGRLRPVVAARVRPHRLPRLRRRPPTPAPGGRTAPRSSPRPTPSTRDRTTFNDVERAQIYLAWRTVAEDYAPFDVNVTTRQPGPVGAHPHEQPADRTYGMPVVISPTNVRRHRLRLRRARPTSACFGVVGATDYQPAWIFTNGSGHRRLQHRPGRQPRGRPHLRPEPRRHQPGVLLRRRQGLGARSWARPTAAARRSGRAGSTPTPTTPRTTWPIIARTAPVAGRRPRRHGCRPPPRWPPGPPRPGLITSRTDTDAFSFSRRRGRDRDRHRSGRLLQPRRPADRPRPAGRPVATVDPTADIAERRARWRPRWMVDLPVTAAS